MPPSEVSGAWSQANGHRDPAPEGPRLEPTTGLGVLHLFCRARTPGGVDSQRLQWVVKEARELDTQVVTVAMLGHKADVGFLALSRNLWQLRDLQTGIQSAGMELVHSYVSLTEVSEYAEGLPEEMKTDRLYPKLPPEGKRAFCFYPMSKRRSADHNWYALPFDERKELMYGHGAVGRRFRGRVLQLVTGSTGVDDYEWGVTLFAVTPDDIKACVYEMRFDEASAHYADFGPFYTGMVANLQEVLDRSLT
jgi:peroxiredoxin